MRILTGFRRDETSECQADFDEIMGNIGLGLLRIGFGKTVIVENKTLHKQEYSTITKIAAISLFILAFPVTTVSAGFGFIATFSSSSHDRFYNLYSQEALDPQKIEITVEEVAEEEVIQEENNLPEEPISNNLQIVLYNETTPVFKKENNELILTVTKHWEKFLNPTPYYLNVLASKTLSSYYNLFSAVTFKQPTCLDMVVYQKPQSQIVIYQKPESNNLEMSQLSTWDSTVSKVSYIFNFCTTAISSTYTSISNTCASIKDGAVAGFEAICLNAKKLKKNAHLFKKNGIDLYPYIKSIHHQTSSAISSNNSNDSSQMSIPPAFAILTQGFVRKLGLNLEQFLKNINTCYGEKIVGKLLVKLGLTQAITEFTANSILQMQNPLGWISTLLTLINTGSSLALLAQNNILKLCNDQIEKKLSKQLSIENAYKIKNNFDKIIRYNEREPGIKYELTRRKQLLEKIAHSNLQKASDLQEELRTEIENLQRELDELRPEDETSKLTNDFASYPQALIQINTYEILVGGLKKIFEKTLTSLVDDLEFKFQEYKTTNKITNPHTDLLLTALKTIILGSDKDSIMHSIIEPNTEILSTAKNVTNFYSQCSEVIKKPATFVASYMPPFISSRLNQVADRVNQFVGEKAGGFAVDYLNKNYLNNFNNFVLFTEDEMKLNLIQNATEIINNTTDLLKDTTDLTNLNENTKPILKFINKVAIKTIDDERGLDLVMSSLLEDVGIELADCIFKIIDEKLQEVLKDENLQQIASNSENPTLTKLFEWDFNAPEKSKK